MKHGDIPSLPLDKKTSGFNPPEGFRFGQVRIYAAALNPYFPLSRLNTAFEPLDFFFSVLFTFHGDNIPPTA